MTCGAYSMAWMAGLVDGVSGRSLRASVLSYEARGITAMDGFR